MWSTRCGKLTGYMAVASRGIVSLLKVFFHLLYGRMAFLYDMVSCLVSLGHWRSWIEQVFPYIEGYRVLELGHGPGHLLCGLGERGLTPLGIDVSFSMNKLALKNLGRENVPGMVINARAEALPLPRNWMQCIVATFPTEYIYAESTLREVNRVLSAGGVLILLPVAWITGASPLERLVAWVFNFTGQTTFFKDKICAPLEAMGFRTEIRYMEQISSRVMLVIARKSGSLGE